MAGYGPCHIVKDAGDKRSVCGATDPMPVVWAPYAPKHRYEMERCPECYTEAGLAEMLTEGTKADTPAIIPVGGSDG